MADNSRILKMLLDKTDPELARTINSDWWAQQEAVRGARVACYRRYVAGDHDQTMTPEMRDLLRITTNDAKLNDINDNYMRRIVDTMAGRLSVQQFDGKSDEANEWIAALLDRSNFDALEGTTYRAAVRDGDAYLLIDPEKMRFTSEPAYNGHDGVSVIYGEADQVIWACKLWSVSGQAMVSLEDEEWDGTEVVMARVYQPNQITAWSGTYGSMVQDTEATVNWSAIGTCAVVPFVNMRDNYSSYGESEIRPAKPIQDIINRTLYSMVMTEEYTGFPVRYAFGFELSTVGLKPGSFVNVPVKANGVQMTELSEEQKNFMQSLQIGSLPAGDMSQFVAVLDKLVCELSQTTQTPMYGITAQGVMSGDALKQLEVGLIAKCKRFSSENTDGWKNAIMLAYKVQQAFATEFGSPPPMDMVAVHWASPQVREVNDDIAAIIQVYKNAPALFPDSWYRRRIGSMLGLDGEEIAKLEDEVKLSQEIFMQSRVGGDGTIPLF